MDERERLIMTGFTLGAIVGGAVVAMLGSRERNIVAQEARSKLNELTTGKSVEEVSRSVRGEVRKVADAVSEAGRTLPAGRG